MSRPIKKRKIKNEPLDIKPTQNGLISKEQAARLGLPDRWLYCPPIGQLVVEKFLPFKTPLGFVYNDLMEQKYWFHPSRVFREANQIGIKIGLWMDFTKTNRYYEKSEIVDRNCLYKKMSLEGRGQAPTLDETNDFINFVNNFFQMNPNDIVAMHCTHGFNRTGFLIVSYLVQELKYSLENAIQEFSNSRPYGIYKQDYLDELCSRYTNGELTIESNGRPIWETEPPLDTLIFNDSNNVPTTSSGSTKHVKPIKNFMNGLVNGVNFVEDFELRKKLQKKIQTYCKFKNQNFPGSQPVSMECSPEKNNLQFLAQHEYMVSWKADGVRYLVLIEGEKEIYAFDRDNNPFLITSITFLNRKTKQHIRNTLVDAEMIIERIGEEIIPRLLIYDIITFEDEDVGQRPFCKRTIMIKQELIDPRTEALKKQLIIRENEPISIRRKDFFLIKSTYKLYEEKFTRNLKHEIDGLIFQPANMPYTPGRFEYLLKWKPPELSTIDFKLKIEKFIAVGLLPEYRANLYVQNLDRPFGQIKPVKKALQQYDKKIVECKYLPTTQSWEVLRERTDKSHPNALATATSVCNTIKYPINLNYLLKFIAEKALQIQ